jgi:hypothetical protein
MDEQSAGRVRQALSALALGVLRACTLRPLRNTPQKVCFSCQWTHFVMLLLLGTSVLLFPLAPAEAGNTDGWALVKTSGDGTISVHERDGPQGYTEFRAVTRVNSTLGGVICLFTDVGNMPGWVYRTKEVRRLAMIGNLEIYAYTVIELPWPFNDRDAVLHILISQDRHTHAVTIRIESVSDYYPLQESRVRMPQVKSTWTVSPVNAGIVEVTFQGYGDPGGNLTSPFFRWFYSLASWEAPLSTLAGLRSRIIQNNLQHHRVSYITEPP